MIGPARTFAAGLAGFAVGMLATGFAPHMHAVIAARAAEGFFAGVFSCVVSAVVMRAYDDAARPRVLALLSAATGGMEVLGLNTTGGQDIAITGSAATRLASFKVPGKVVFVDEIPKGATGKLTRIGLAKLLGLE